MCKDDITVQLSLDQLNKLIDAYNQLLPLIDKVRVLDSHVAGVQVMLGETLDSLSSYRQQVQQLDAYIKHGVTDFQSLCVL